MIANINTLPLKTYSDILNYIRREGSPRPHLMSYHLAKPSIHFEDGFRDVIDPQINTETQRRGVLIYDDQNDVVTYQVIDFTPEEIEERTKNQVLAQAEIDRFQKLQEAQEKAIMDSYQSITDPAEALANQSIYPFWSPDAVEVKLGEKYQAFDGTELKLYEVIQAHTTQADWNPPAVPALFKRVAVEGQILPWVQPTGAHDAYNIGDKVSYQAQNWESTVDANIYAPGVVSGQWVVI
ncbi:hypothetical protein V8V91_08495 [Algoriphagus halophilus]|uniref:hypothetical protein n=1 Tax=Algoriphagus halophilus TaxID=226505 RepID=UPI00358E044E